MTAQVAAAAPSRRSMLLGACGAVGVLATAGDRPSPQTGMPIAGSSLESAYAAVLQAINRDKPQLAMPDESTSVNDLAWGTAYLLRARVGRALAFGDEAEMRSAADLADRCLALRDSDRSLRDHAGQMTPTWPAGSPYTVRQGAILSRSNDRLFTLSSVGQPGENASGASVAPAGKGRFRIVVTGTAGSQIEFDGLSTSEPDGRYAPRLFLNKFPGKWWLTAQDARAAGDRVALDLQAQDVDFTPMRVAFAVHTGMLMTPILQLSSLLAERKPKERRRAKSYSEAGEAAWGHHQSELVMRADGAGHMAFQRKAPVRGEGIAMPHNQSLCVATMLAALGDATSDANYKSLAISLFQGWANDSGDERDAAEWPYFPSGSLGYTGYGPEDGVAVYAPAGRANTAVDDASHGGLVADCVATLSASGVAVGSAATRLQRTYSLMDRNGPEGFARNVAGQFVGLPENAALWAKVAPRARLRQGSLPWLVGQASQGVAVHPVVALCVAQLGIREKG